METLWQDLRFGARQLLRSRGFTAVAVLTLALGIGATTAIFSVVNAVLLRPLPLRQPDQLVWMTSVRPERSDAPFSLPEYLDYRVETTSLEHLVAFTNWSAVLTGQGDAERLQGMRISADAFDALGVAAERGRTLQLQDDSPASPRVVVLRHQFWARRFGADPNLIGQKLLLNGESYEVVGILPPGFPALLDNMELAVPLSPETDPWRDVRNSVNFLRFASRLKPGVTREAAEAELTAVAQRLRERFPVEYARKIGVKLTPLQDHLVGNYRLALGVLLGAVAFVLLIACVNLASLMLVRATARHQEMALRAALGASSFRLIRQLFTEAMALALLGGAAGVLLASWGVELLLAVRPADLPRVAEVSLDGRVVSFAFLLTLLTGVAFGLAPALRVSRSRLQETLKAAGRQTSALAGGLRSRSLLVAVEIGLAVVLLAGAGLLGHSFVRVLAVEPGFDTEHLLVARIALPRANYPTPQALTSFCEQLHTQLASLPGVESVGMASIVPLSDVFSSVPVTAEGRPAATPKDMLEGQYRVINVDYLRTLRIPVLRGRGFTESDDDRSRPVALISETLAAKLFPDSNAIGARILVDDNDTAPRPIQVVGVVGQVKQLRLDGQATDDLYIPVRQVHPDGLPWMRNNQFWVLRTAGDPMALAESFRGVLRQVDGDVPASSLRPMQAYVASSLAARRFTLVLILLFAGAALLLAFMGVYGVVSYTVSLRTREIGIRLAVGAQPRDILRHIIGQGMKVTLLGTALGLVVALGVMRWLTSLLFGVRSTDVLTYGGVLALLLLATLVASWLPARRAARVDPMVALRYE